MKRASIAALFLSFVVVVAQAEIFPPLTPKNAKSMALGGSFSSIPTAEFSFFGNPAAFAAPKGSLTIISTDAWAYIKPTLANLRSFSEAANSSNAFSAIAGLMPTNGGIGGGGAASIGYAGKGLGLGFFAVSDGFAAGDTIPGAVFKSDTELSAVIGLGIPVKLFGSTLSIGGDLRPFYRIRSDTALADIVNAVASGPNSQGSALDSLGASAGFGLAMDLGASLQLGSFGIGLAIRDIAPSFPIWKGSLQELFTSLQGGSFPTATDSSNTANLIPNITAGLSWKPRLLPGVVDPALYLELQDPVSVARNWSGAGSALNLLHVGAEVKLISFITLRGGINRGWLSAGAGVKLLFLDLNAAVFTEELGALAGDSPRSGLSVQAAIRF